VYNVFVNEISCPSARDLVDKIIVRTGAN